MKLATNHTALLLFSRSANNESASKELLKGKHQNLHAIRMLIERSKKIAKQSGLSLFIHTEVEQRGSTFGEKIYASIADVFDQGFEKVVVIGNDCLQLTARNIIDASLQLCIYDQVLAPTKNGGVYLLGISKATFQKGFAAVRWQTPHVYDDLTLLASKTKASVFHVPYLNDVNNYYDLLKEVKYLPALDKFRIILQSFIASFYKVKYFPPAFSVQILYASNILRGPPLI